MRTEALIKAMAADSVRRRAVGPVLVGIMVVLAALIAAAAIAALGLNRALGTMMTGPLFLLRQVFPLLLGLGAFLAALRLARPGANAGPTRWLLVAALVLAGAVVLRELVLVPTAAWGRAAMGETSLDCLLSVTLIAAPLLAGALWALGRGASTRPRASGALAGLLAGSISAAIYALHCTETSPLFYVVWYGIAILGITALGAVIGPRLLRW